MNDLTITDRDREMAKHDASFFYMVYAESCPTCGANLTKLGPLTNLYPHFAGICKNPEKVA